MNAAYVRPPGLPLADAQKPKLRAAVDQLKATA